MANWNKLVQFSCEGNEVLIPGLPDDLAMECLLRVPITSHPKLRLVSHLWKSTVSQPCYFSYRRRFNFAENHVFLIQPQSPVSQPLPQQSEPEEDDKSDVIGAFPHGDEKEEEPEEAVTGSGPLLYNLNMYNTNHEEWRCLSGVTIPTFAQCVVLPVVGKLVVLGGWDPATLEPVSRVLVLDLAVGKWREGAPMPTARSFFACTTVGPNTVYVAGGHDGQKNALKSAEAYDVMADEWRALPPMSEERDESYGLSLSDDGKFWVISGYGTESQGRFRPDAEVFDPEMQQWSTVSGVWPYPGNTPKSTAVVTVDGRKRWWHLISGEIREFEWGERVWRGVNLGVIPKVVSELWSSSSSISLIDVGNGKILLMGNGGEEMFMLARQNQDKMINNNNDKSGVNGNWTWQNVHVPSRFLGFPFSASHLLI